VNLALVLTDLLVDRRRPHEERLGADRQHHAKSEESPVHERRWSFTQMERSTAFAYFFSSAATSPTC